jgi:hypothetical protein
LVLLLGGEVVLDVKGLANLLGRLALNHVGDGLAADVEERLDVEVVGGLLGCELVTPELNKRSTPHTKMISKSIS